MISQNETRRVNDAAGPRDCSLPSENVPGNGVPHQKNQFPLSPVDCARRDMIRELFTESIILALGFGLNSLHAAQQGDDDAAIGEFRGFRAAAQTAGECCKELRGIVEESRA